VTDHQRETAFLRHVILYDDTAERHKLGERIAQLQSDERCVRRAVWLMVLLTALAMAGLCYTAVFLANHPHDVSEFVSPVRTRILCALGLGSLICLVSFLGLGVVYRKELDQRREQCRQLATKLLESRLGKPCTTPLPGVIKEQEIIL